MTSITLSDADTVSVALAPIAVPHMVPVGHKFARRPITAGEVILKYGQAIGVATSDIPEGGHVHTHNCAYDADIERQAAGAQAASATAPARRSFMGFRRPDGRVGTRNYIGIISTVNCSASVVAATARRANETLLAKHPYVDGFVPITHELGCGMSGVGSEAYSVLHRTIEGYKTHPNFGASLMIGLGCEVNQLSAYADVARPEQFGALNIQETGGTRATIEAALKRLDVIAATLKDCEREECGVEDLILGMQCGGSDAFSGLSSNPALGVASDMLVAAGSTTICSETPEIFGAEHLLTSRSDPAVGAEIDGLIAWWRAYVDRHGASLDNNPSPGNKAGGLTTILEKSLGAVAKAGRARVSSVAAYAERPKTKGLIYMDTPGYDPVVATGQTAGGANVLAFTTGRGSCFGSKPAPTIKLANTTRLYDALTDDMDVNCGRVLDGEATLEAMGAEIYDLVLDVASGKKTLSEENGVGDLEFAPWRLGAVL